MAERILLAVDDTEASAEAVRYAGELLAGSAATLVLLHVVEPPPGTASDLRPVPGMFALVPARFGHDPGRYRHHLAIRARALPVLERMQRLLVEAGVAGTRIKTVWLAADRSSSPGRDILASARRMRCGTILVGRHALPWHREALHRHVGDWLAKHGSGIALWIVGGEEERPALLDPHGRPLAVGA